jgi:FtsP/CotA-like multicopper oxidase with cupredoxin domain
MKDMGMDHGGMDQYGGKNPAAVRGVDPSAEQNASSRLAAATGWNAPTDHGSTAATAATAAAGGAMAGMDHSAMGHSAMGHGEAAPAMDHGSMDMRDFSKAPGVKKGPGVQSISPMPTDRTGEAPQGLEGLDHKVLVYRDLVALERNPDVRAPSRSLDIHLTGNMERYMWSFDGVKLSEPAQPIPFRLGERVRINLINDTMMPHPIHLHGHFFELVTGHGAHGPRKHTVNVPPGGKMTFDVTADAAGDWAFHCHNLYHMAAGMMRVVTVRPLAGDTQNDAS